MPPNASGVPAGPVTPVGPVTPDSPLVAQRAHPDASKDGSVVPDTPVVLTYELSSIGDTTSEFIAYDI